MSDTAHTVPGQSILERLYSRGTLRPRIGASTSFYERFGLTDPWLDERLWSGEDSEGEGQFFFLSAAPYYRRLRSQRQREWRARRRLLMRLSTSAHRLHGRSIESLSQPGPASGAWLSVRRPALALSAESAMVMLPALLLPTEPEAVERRPRFRDGEERRREAPMARALRQAARPVAAVPAALEEVISVASRRQRRVLRRIIEEVAVLPAEEQVVVARQVTRQLRGPAARAARVDVEEAADDTGRTPIAVASSRASVPRSKGLRPVLTSSPSLRTLTFEEPPTEEAAPVVRRRVSRVIAPSAYQEVPQAEVVREVRTQRVTGRAGPAVVVETAAASARPRRRPTEWAATLAQGNERSATSDSSYGLRSVEPPVRRRPAGVERIAARSVAVPATGTRGEALVAPSATAFLSPRRPVVPTTTRVVRKQRGPDALPIEEPATAPTQRVLDRGTVTPRAGRRSRLVAAPPTAYVAPIEVVEERAPAVRPSRRRVRVVAPPEEPLRREKPAREAPPPHRAVPRAVVAAPAEVPVERPRRAVPLTQRAVARSVIRPRRDDRGDQLLAAPPVARRIVAPEPEAPRRPTAPMWRAAARGEEPRRRVRAVRLAVAPMAHVAPIEEPVVQEAPSAPRRRVRRPRAPTVRAAQRIEIAAPAVEPSRVALARTPTSYLRAPVAPEPKRPAIERPAEPERRRSRSTVRAAARAVVAPRTDARGSALLTSGATDYLQVAASAEPDGPLSRSPVVPSRVRRMRGAAVDTEAIVQPVEPPTAEPVPGRPVRRRAPVARPTPTARVARRLEVARQEEAYVPAPRPPVPVAEPRTRAPARERILVRDERGQVRPVVRVASGAAAYASARLVTIEPVSEPVEETPLRRATVTRHAPRRPMPHTVVRDDFRWLVPEPAPRVRVEGERRIGATGPVSRDRLQDVLSRVTSVVRAVERADDARVIVPATRRTLEGARVVVERVRMRRAPTVTGEVLLRVILPEEVTPVEHAERRGKVPVAREAMPTPVARPLRRAFAGAEGLPQDDAVDRAMSRAQPAPTERRRTAARTLRTSDGRYAPSPTRRRLAPEPTLAGFGLGEPGLPRRRARVDTASGAVLPKWEDEEVAEEIGRPIRPRPLRSTLQYMGEEDRPEARRPEVAPPRRVRPMRRAAPPEALLAPPGAELDEEPPAWAHRAVHGTSLRRAPEDEVVPRPTRGSSGNLFNALARASSPDDVVQVILERGGSIGAAARELPEPAIRLVRRIVRIQEAASAEARYVERPRREVLAPRHKRRTSATASTRFSTLSKPSQAPAAAARQRVTSLTQKLMKLIHLAEVERKVAEAQREVRMARPDAEAAAEGGGREAGGEAGAPNLKKLESDVLAAVIQELDLMKLRRQEDFNDVWW
jgi:hypothetical protein